MIGNPIFPRRVLGTCIFLVAGVIASTAAAQKPPAVPPLPVIRGEKSRQTGVFLNSSGDLVTAFLPGVGQGHVLDIGKTSFPLVNHVHQRDFGLTFLRIKSAPVLNAAPLSARSVPSGTQLRLAWPAPDGSIQERELSVREVRRVGAPELSLRGVLYDLGKLADPVPPGAPLLNSAGEVAGMLLATVGRDGESYALSSATLRERDADVDKSDLGPSGSAVTPNPPMPSGSWIETAQGARLRATLRQMKLASFTPSRPDLVRATQDWRNHSGGWVSVLTPPEVNDGACYFGSTNGNVYRVDIPEMQRRWPWESSRPAIFAPVVGPGLVFTTTGDLGFGAAQHKDPILRSIFGGDELKKKRLFDFGNIHCLDRNTGEHKWTYSTRFLGPPRLSGDYVLFAGLGIFGALGQQDGKRVWLEGQGLKDDSPTFYRLVGANSEHMWMLELPVRLDGEGTKKEPFRLVTADNASIGCYTVAKGKTVWKRSLPGARAQTALDGDAQFSADGTRCFGVVGRQAFGIETATGKVLWRQEALPEAFGGGLVVGDGLLLGTGERSALYALDVRDGSLRWTFRGTEAPLSNPYIHEGVVYVGSYDTHLYALNAQTGKSEWKLATGARICGQPRVLSGQLYFTSDDGSLSQMELPQ